VRLHALCEIYFIFVFSLVYVSDSRLCALVNVYVFDFSKLASLIMRLEMNTWANLPPLLETLVL
jgi:hypothetical protein